MKKLLCGMVALIMICSALAFACAGFDSSVFEGNDGYSVREADGSWLYFRGIVFNDIGEKSVQLSVQADGSGTDHAPMLRLFTVVTNSRENSVTDFGTPNGLRLYINDEKQADLRLNGKYSNPACASVTLAGEGENLCRLLSDLRSLSFDLAFEGNDRLLSYELTEKDIGVFRRTVGSMCGSLLESGIFDAARAAGSADDAALISITDISAVPEDRAADTPEPAAELTPEPTAEPTPAPTAESATVPEPETPAEIPASDSASAEAPVTQSFSGIRTGDIVRMGSYVQEDPEKREPIEWQVLTVNKKTGQALLLSRQALDAVSFGEAGNPEEYSRAGLSWENSAVRNWLNGDFCSNAFSDAEKDRILETAVRTKDKAGSHHTADRIFLLNAQEVRRYLKTANQTACRPTSYARAKLRQDSQAVSPEGYCCWMLRELVRVPVKGVRGEYVQGTGNEVGYVNQNHGLRLFNQWIGCPVQQSGLCAIRPAMWIRIY